MFVDLNDDPIEVFKRWLEKAQSSDLAEPAAFTLATVDKDGMPDARVLLLRGIDERGFIFYTNYESEKGLQLKNSPKAALCFYWMPMNRQVRIRGSVTKLGTEESDEYFSKRPVGHRLGARVSDQSRALDRYETLKERWDKEESRFDGNGNGAEIPRPDYWGGYVLSPISIEFWQSEPNRLHKRIKFIREGKSRWESQLLYP